MCWCGNECVGEVCRDCLLIAAPYVRCVKCGVEIRVGFALNAPCGPKLTEAELRRLADFADCGGMVRGDDVLLMKKILGLFRDAKAALAKGGEHG